jgi:cytochrome c peroxidase
LIEEGRALFFDPDPDGVGNFRKAQCFRCHDGEALDRSLVGFTDGVFPDHFDIGNGSDGTGNTTNILANRNDGCENGTFDPTLPLPPEQGIVNEPREFNTMPLIGIGRTGPFFHDGSAGTLQDAISHYVGVEFNQSSSAIELARLNHTVTIGGAQVPALVAFVEALTVVPEPRAALLQAFGLATLWGLRRLRRS